MSVGCGDPEAYLSRDAGSASPGTGGSGGTGGTGGTISPSGGAGNFSTGLAGDGGADSVGTGFGGTTGAAGSTTGAAGQMGAAGSTGGAAGATGGTGPGAAGTGGAGGVGGATMGGAGTTGAAGHAGAAGATGAAGSAGATGAAGTTGAGGMAGSGAGGTGGVKVVTGACAGKVHAAAAVIDTFEDGSLTNWYEYKDSTVGATLSPLTIVSPGAASTSKALQLSGSGFQGFGAGAGFMTLCTDASAFQGITFWAKGTSGTSNDIALQVAIPQTQATADGGDCTTSCFDHPSKKVALTSAWQQYHVLFTDLAQAGFGAPAKYAGIVMALNWVSIEGPAVNFQIDEISYY
jgi:hypothetical protein